jgi:hypothetical protein
MPEQTDALVNTARALTRGARSCVTALPGVWMRVVAALPVCLARRHASKGAAPEERCPGAPS